MQITKAMMDDAIDRGIVDRAQGRTLWDFLASRVDEEAGLPSVEDAAATPRFKAAHILYYLGGLIAIGAMTLFMTLGWERFGGGGLLTIALVYGTLAILSTELLLRRESLQIPAGITATLAIAMVPLAVYGVQVLAGFWSGSGPGSAYRDFHTQIDWRWLLMELAALAAGVVALYRYRLPFMVMPVAVTLWYMSMDLGPFLFGGDSASIFSDSGKAVSIAFGLAVTLVAFFVDLRSTGPRDFAFWLYLFGVLSFWGALTSLDPDDEIAMFFYCAGNLLMILVGAALSRRVFAVFGGLGVALYLGHLSYSVFKDSLMFPFALTLIGFGVIAIGVFWQRREAAIGEWTRSFLPVPVRNLVMRRAR